MLSVRRQGRRIPAELWALAEMVFIFFVPVLLSRNIPLLWDLRCYSHPGFYAFRESVMQGSLPLWNPYSGCGEPLLADVERAFFYPPNLIYLLVPICRAMMISSALHVLLAGVGAYALSRVWGGSRVGSLLSGVLYAFNGFTITKLDYLSQLCSLAWFPLVLAAFVLWLRRRTGRLLFLLAGALCLQFLAGHVETLLFSVAALAMYSLFVGVQEWRTHRRWRSAFVPVLGLGGAGILALLLSMAQFLPTWEALQLSVRGGVADQALDAYSLHPLAVFSLLIPSIYGVPGSPGCYWASLYADHWLRMFYVGIVPIAVFVSVAIFKVLGQRAGPEQGDADSTVHVRVPFLITLGAFFFVYSTGKHTPLFTLCLQLFPPLQWFTMPPKSLLCVVLSLSCLTGIGIDWLAGCQGHPGSSRTAWRGFLMRWGSFMFFAAVALFMATCLVNDAELGKAILRRYFNLSSVEAHSADLIPWNSLLLDGLKLPALGLAAAFLLRLYVFRPRIRLTAGWLIVAISFCDLLTAHGYLLMPGPDGTLDQPSRLLGKLRPEGKTARFFGLYPAFPSDLETSLPKGRRTEVLEETAFAGPEDRLRQAVLRLARQLLHKSCPLVDKAFSVHSMGNFLSHDVDHLVGTLTAPGVPLETKERLLALLNCDRLVFQPTFFTAGIARSFDATRLLTLDEPLSRAYVVGGMKILDDNEAVFLSLTFVPFDPLAFALTNQDSANGDSFTDLTPGRVSHKIHRLEYGQNTLEVDVETEAPGILVVSDTYFPGWRATVNKRVAPIYKVNGAFRGVRIPRGFSKVRMDYVPKSLLIGVVVSLVALVVFVWVVTRRPERGLERDLGDRRTTPTSNHRQDAESW